MENPKNKIAEQLKESSNVLVTVSTDPSVDQLAAAIGLTLILNRLGKHATAVFSGKVPSTIEFLQPGETIEKNTDSLRDFIIALDKSKADKLRYKVEDKVVKIFITPYRTSIGQKDLEFSQGDFNVDIIIGLGVRIRDDLDQAITAHGRILHDATVVSINTSNASNLGSINWADEQASSLCEMVVALADMLKTGLLDSQISTSLLTGIVAETDRFSNAKTTSTTMAASAKLMSAGANQQLVATKLQEPEKPEEHDKKSPKKDNSPDSDDGDNSADGALHIDHEELPEPDVEQIDIDEHGNLHLPDKTPQTDNTPQVEPENRHLLVDSHVDSDKNLGMPDYESSPTEPVDQQDEDLPSLDSRMTANTQPEDLDPATDPLSSTKSSTPILSHDSGPAKIEDDITSDVQPSQTQANEPSSSSTDPTLSEIEESVDSPHSDQLTSQPGTESQLGAVPPDIEQARNAVQSVVAQTPPETPLEPIQALNAQPVNLDLGHDVIDDTASPVAQVPPGDLQIDPSTGNIQPMNQPGPSPISIPPVAAQSTPQEPLFASNVDLPPSVPPMTGLTPNFRASTFPPSNVNNNVSPTPMTNYSNPLQPASTFSIPPAPPINNLPPPPPVPPPMMPPPPPNNSTNGTIPNIPR